MADTKKTRTKATPKEGRKSVGNSKPISSSSRSSSSGKNAKDAKEVQTQAKQTQDDKELYSLREATHEKQLQASGDVSALLARLQVLAQYLKDLSFESPNAPQIFTPQQGQTPQFSLDIRVKADKLASERHEVTLLLKVAMTRGEQACFLAEIIYSGLIAVPAPAPEESLLQALLLIEVPRLLFPYARNILSELTQSSGFPPLVVQPVDFAALYRKQLAEARASASSG